MLKFIVQAVHTVKLHFFFSQMKMTGKENASAILKQSNTVFPDWGFFYFRLQPLFSKRKIRLSKSAKL